jgi:hypothetical protein
MVHFLLSSKGSEVARKKNDFCLVFLSLSHFEDTNDNSSSAPQLLGMCSLVFGVGFSFFHVC